MVGADHRLQQEALVLTHQSCDVATLFARLQGVLNRHVGFDGCCWLTFDPATVLPTGHIPYRSIPADQVPRLAQNEYFEDDVNKFVVLSRAASPVGILDEATGGRPERSARYRVLLEPNGFRHEMRTVFNRDGACWGGIALYRKSAEPFCPAEASRLASVAGVVADGIRRGLLVTALGDQESSEPSPDTPGLVLLGVDNCVDAVSVQAERWLSDLVVESEDPSAHELPSVVYAVASHARRIGSGEVASEPASARAHTRSGRWVVLHASLLDRAAEGRVSVIIEPARPPQVAPLIAMAYGLSVREREVTRLVLQGHSTAEIAQALFLSAHTVQDYLKSIFEKIGVRSRREMVGRVFVEQYSPRLERGELVGADGWFRR